MSDLAVFDQHLRRWALAACEEWSYEPPPVEWYEAVHARLPPGLRAALGRALDQGLIITADAHRFAPAGLPEGKGPYAWFSQSRRLHPAPNWRYFIQAAEWAHVRAAHPDCEIGFDDRSMDISVSRHDDLLWSVDVYERLGKLAAIATEIRGLGEAGIDMEAADRDNDAERKAKTIVELRPVYFSLVGIGGRLDFSVVYHDVNRFELISDVVTI